MVIGLMLLTGTVSASAQDENIYGMANRVGVGVGIGTEGIGFDVAVPLTKYVQARVGLNFIPNININTSVDVTGENEYYDYNGEMDKWMLRASSHARHSTSSLTVTPLPMQARSL